MSIKKLWQNPSTSSGLNREIEAFETKEDLQVDQQLISYDIQGSLAHAKMLYKIGILSKKELTKLLKGLNEIFELNSQDKFKLQFGDEDMHTKIENYLSEKYGEVGKKIHTGRSRNDQILTALRLYSRENLEKIKAQVTALIKSFKIFDKKYGHIPMPGYTHMQKAMPSSIGPWLGSFIASLEDDLEILNAAYGLIDQSPLGSAAGYGLPIKLDKKYTANLLGFKKIQENPIYCQHSRGKFEAVILAALIQVLLTINKFASDIMLFATQEFSFFEATEKVITGSSIMPQKKNLDVAELLRSKVHLVLGNYVQIVSLSSNLISGYNRDLQDSKKPLIDSFEITLSSLTVTQILLGNLIPNKAKLEKAMTDELYLTEKALEFVKKGMPFREAYKKV